MYTHTHLYADLLTIWSYTVTFRSKKDGWKMWA